MLSTIRYLFSICLILLSSNLIAQAFLVKNHNQYVDPFIGTGNTPRGGSCVFPGAMLPFGMLKPLNQAWFRHTDIMMEEV